MSRYEYGGSCRRILNFHAAIGCGLASKTGSRDAICAKKTLTDSLSLYSLFAERTFVCMKRPRSHTNGVGEFEVTITSAPDNHTSRKDRDIDKDSSNRDGSVDMGT